MALKCTALCVCSLPCPAPALPLHCGIALVTLNAQPSAPACSCPAPVLVTRRSALAALNAQPLVPALFLPCPCPAPVVSSCSALPWQPLMPGPWCLLRSCLALALLLPVLFCLASPECSALCACSYVALPLHLAYPAPALALPCSSAPSCAVLPWQPLMLSPVALPLLPAALPACLAALCPSNPPPPPPPPTVARTYSCILLHGYIGMQQQPC